MALHRRERHPTRVRGAWRLLPSVLLLVACSGLDALEPSRPLDPTEVTDALDAGVEVEPGGPVPAQAVPNVGSVDELRAALADATVSVIILAAGNYAINDPAAATLTGELMVTRAVTIRAADGLSRDDVVIDATPVEPAVASRVMTVDPGAGSRVTLEGLTITGGRDVSSGAGGAGGGIVHNSGALDLLDVVFRDNATSGVGGGVASKGSLRVIASLFEGNAARSGGGLHSTMGTFVADSTFSGNTVLNLGAAWYSYTAGGTCSSVAGATAVNSTFSGNSGNEAIYITYGVVELLHVTIVANQGAGLFSFPNSSTCARLSHVIVAGNSGIDVVGVSGSVPAVASRGFNLVGTTSGNVSFAADFAPDGSSIGIGDADPRLEALGDHGGPLPTMPPTFHSPARNGGVLGEGWWAVYWSGIRAALPAEVIAWLAKDQRGQPRPQRTRADIGAVERTPASPAVIVDTGPAWVGLPVHVQAIFAAPVGEDPPQGVVVFGGGQEPPCEAELAQEDDRSLADCWLTFPDTGPQDLTVSYLGSVDHAPGAALQQVDVQAAPSIALRLDPALTVQGQPLVLAFEVSYHDGSSGTGALAVVLSGEEIASGNLVGGRLTTLPMTLSAGVHEVEVRFDSALPRAPQVSRTYRVDLATATLLTLGLGPAGPEVTVIGPSSQATVIAQVSVGATQEALWLEKLRFALSGQVPEGAAAGLNVGSLGTLRLHVDHNGNGVRDVDDVELGRVAVVGPGLLELVLEEPLGVGAGTALRLLLLASPADAQAGWVRVAVAGAWGALALLGLGVGPGLRGPRPLRLRRLRGLGFVVVLFLSLAACGGQGGASAAAVVVELRLIGADASAVASGDGVITTGTPVDLPSVTIRAGP